MERASGMDHSIEGGSRFDSVVKSLSNPVSSFPKGVEMIVIPPGLATSSTRKKSSCSLEMFGWASLMFFTLPSVLTTASCSVRALIPSFWSITSSNHGMPTLKQNIEDMCCDEAATSYVRLFKLLGDVSSGSTGSAYRSRECESW